MTNAKRTVTLIVSPDTSYLGDAATSEDVDSFRRNLTAEIESRFGVTVLSLRGTADGTDSDDPEVRAWLRQISSTDEWTQYL